MTAVTEPLMAARIEASEERVELRLSDRISALADQIRSLADTVSTFKSANAEALGDIKTSLSHKAGRWTVIMTIAGASVALVAIAGFATNRFDAGMNATGNLAQQAVDYDTRIAKVDAKLDTLIEGQKADGHKSESGDKKRIAGPIHR